VEATTATEKVGADGSCIVVSESKRLPCDLCGHPMEPEHAHYKCPACHYILPCCGW
jgi:Zn finger protein HypA/HybF involved in hydrogenase expression